MKTRFPSLDCIFHAGVIKAFLLSLILAACTGQPAREMTAKLAPGPDETLAMTVAARGVQIYECRNRLDADAAFEWTFVAPEAELLDARGRVIGTHGAGPFWQSMDGSRVAGSLKTRVDAPVSGAIPWLLLATKTTGHAGTFSKVTSIQRVNTAGGMAPETTCSAETIGARARVPYSADYNLFVAR